MRIVTWLLLAVIAGMGIGWYVTRAQLVNKVELARISELESEQSGADSAMIRSLLVTTPKEKVKDELMKKVAELRDSADVLRRDVRMTKGSVAPEMEHEIDHIRRHATELESLAGRTADPSLPDRARLQLYRQVVLTYGAASFVARQMRNDIGLPSWRN